MTHQDNLAAVRAACIAANPEIADLKFGCEVRLSINEFDHEYCTIVERDGNGNIKLQRPEHEDTWVSSSGEGVEILGREITLPDVLLALDVHHHGKLAVEVDGGFLAQVRLTDEWAEVKTFTGEYREQIRWDLKASLSGQSEETVAYLAALLKPND